MLPIKAAYNDVHRQVLKCSRTCRGEPLFFLKQRYQQAFNLARLGFEVSWIAEWRVLAILRSLYIALKLMRDHFWGAYDVLKQELKLEGKYFLESGILFKHVKGRKHSAWKELLSLSLHVKVDSFVIRIRYEYSMTEGICRNDIMKHRIFRMEPTSIAQNSANELGLRGVMLLFGSKLAKETWKLVKAIFSSKPLESLLASSARRPS